MVTVLTPSRLFAGRGRGRFDIIRRRGPVPHGETGAELCGHRLGGLGDLPEGIRDQLLRGRLPVPAGQRVAAHQSRDRAEPGQVVRPAVGRARTVVCARHAGPAHPALHGPVQPRASQELPRHEGGHLLVQVNARAAPNIIIAAPFKHHVRPRRQRHHIFSGSPEIDSGSRKLRVQIIILCIYPNFFSLR